MFPFPPACALPGLNVTVPHVFEGDEAFSLREHLLKPYHRRQSVTDKSKAIYNYRLSRVSCANIPEYFSSQLQLYHK